MTPEGLQGRAARVRQGAGRLPGCTGQPPHGMLALSPQVNAASLTCGLQCWVFLVVQHKRLEGRQGPTGTSTRESAHAVITNGIRIEEELLKGGQRPTGTPHWRLAMASSTACWASSLAGFPSTSMRDQFGRAPLAQALARALMPAPPIEFRSRSRRVS